MWRADMPIWIQLVGLLVHSLTNADGVLYVSEGNVPSDEASSSCNLVTPDIHFGVNWNTVSLDGADLNIAYGESVWSGYIQTYAAFLYEGCFEQNPSNSSAIHTNMSMDPGQCFSKCNTTVIGLQSTTCHCIPRREQAWAIATGCNIECLNPTGTVCGGRKTVSIYRRVTYPVTDDGDRAEHENCRALFWKNQNNNKAHFYSWRQCSIFYAVMCGIGSSSSEFEFHSRNANWSHSAKECLSKAKKPALEFISGFPNLSGMKDFNNLIWIGQIRSRVIGKDVDSNGGEPGWRRGVITKSGENFVLQFDTDQTMIKSLCEKVSTSAPGELRTSREQNSTPDDDPKNPIIVVYTAVPAVLVLVAVVVIVILCKQRKRTSRKTDDSEFRQDNDHNGLGTRHVVSNEYQDGDVRHDTIILEPVEYAVVKRANINVASDTEYDTTTNLNKSYNDTDNVYNKLKSLSDDTYNHTNTAAASVDDTYDNTKFNEQESAYNTTNTLPSSSIGHVIDTDGVYSKVNTYTGT